MRTLLRSTLSAFLLAMTATPALAQDATPAASATPAAEATAAAVPAPPAKAKRPARPAAPAVPSVAPSAPATPDENARREQNVVADAKDEVSYRVSRAKRRFESGTMAAPQRAEAQVALDRTEAQLKEQVARVDDALARPGLGTEEHIARVHGEVAALAALAHTGASQIEAVRTHDDDTEETLQSTSDEIDAIGDKVEDLADKLQDLADDVAESSSSTDTDDDDVHGVGVLKGKDGTVHVGVHTKNDRVEYGGPVEVKKGEKVNDAVSFGGPVTVAGDVLGDAVSFGGNLHVTESGHVHGDASAFGGRVIVDDGGRVDGEKTQVGAGKIGEALLPGLVRSAGPPRIEHSLPTRIGIGLLRAGAEFLVFFLLGMLVLLLAPKRIVKIAEGVEMHPVKAGLVGAGAWIATVPITALLALLILALVGVVLLPLFVAAVTVGAFFGYVAIAIVIGRKIPTGVLPTQNAFFAIGAAVIVAVGMIPFVGTLVWMLLGAFALGAVIITRFGAEDAPTSGGSTGDPGTLEAANA